MTSPGGTDGSLALSQLARDLHLMGTAGQKALRRRMTELGAPLLERARANASWSSRIPGAISVQGVASEASVTAGVQLRVSAAAAPHARPYEGLGQGGSFRHPVFGHDTWVSQATRPYALPAVQATSEDARQAVQAAIEDAAREAGFH